MNIDTENLRSQLNSCSRTQDEVAKESITKGLEFLDFLSMKGGVVRVTNSASSQ